MKREKTFLKTTLPSVNTAPLHSDERGEAGAKLMGPRSAPAYFVARARYLYRQWRDRARLRGSWEVISRIESAVLGLNFLWARFN